MGNEQEKDSLINDEGTFLLFTLNARVLTVCNNYKITSK